MPSQPLTWVFKPATLLRSNPSTVLRIPILWQRTLTTTTSSPQAAQPQRKEDADHNQAETTAAIDQLFDMDRVRRTRQPVSNTDRTKSIVDGLLGDRPPRVPQTKNGSPSSADEFGAASRRFGEGFSDPNKSSYRSLKRQSLNWAAMDLGETMPEATTKTPVPQPIDEKDINWQRLNPSTGRTVELDASKGRDIVRGINMLGSLMARNKVRSDFQKQRFHERNGLKRKRLKSERWRARFKQGFDEVTRRVGELTRKGW